MDVLKTSDVTETAQAADVTNATQSAGTDNGAGISSDARREIARGDISDIPENHPHFAVLADMPADFRRYILALESRIDALSVKIHGPNG